MIGTKLADRYEIVDELGRGGMGVVYRARDPLLEREVAVKLVPPTLLTPDGELRFLREAQVVAKMDHPAIVTVYDIGRHDGSLFFVMPIVHGTNLRAFIENRSLRLGDVLDIGAQVAEALAYSHAQGVVHRDIKPENVMVFRGAEDESPRVRIMDFGLAQVSFESQLTRITQAGTLIGTVSYLSPEQVTGAAELDGRSDVYSLGVVLYECLVGEPPFVGEIQSVLYRINHEIPQPLNALGADVDPELELLVLSCLAKDPAQRPQRARAVADALARYRGRLSDDELARPVRTAARSARGSHYNRVQSPIVGREKEVAELQWRLNAAVTGECQFAVIGGDAGMGKTRLLEELENLARARKIRVLHGRFVEQDRAFPYQGFCEVVQDFFVTRDASTSSSAPPELSDLAPDLIRLFPVLTEIGEIRTSATGDSKRMTVEAAQAVEDRTSVFELLARTIGRLAGGRPLVLVFEDLHKAEISIEALQYIVRRLGPTPTLIVGSYRPSELDRRHPLVRMLDNFSGDRRFVALNLAPLTPSEHRLFIESLAGGQRVADAPAAKLYEATEGNPFFTKELVRSLIDSGGIAEDETGMLILSAELGITSDALPATIQQAVEKRIEGLPDDMRDVLSMAAVLGRTFEFRDLEVLAEGKVDADEAVDRLVRQGLLEEERESRGDRMTFASGVVRDVLYAALARRKRRSLHRRYAEQLEKRHAGRLERVYSQLAHHYSQGDVADKAVEYGLKAARRSLASFSSDEAARAAKSALEFLEDEWEGDRALEGEARMLLADAYRIEGNIDGALREAERAVRVFEEERDPARAAGALLVAAETAWVGRKVEETKRWVDKGIDAARAGGANEELGRLLPLAATVANLRGEYESAKLLLEEAEQLHPRAKDAEVEIPRGGRVVVATTTPVTALEPVAIVTTEEEEILANVFERLLTTDAQGSLLPSLCQKWEVLDGGRSMLLSLRRFVTFSDGHPMTAADVRASFEHSVRATTSALPPALAAIRGAADFASLPSVGPSDRIEGLVERGEHALEIRLAEPLPIYPSLLTDLSAAIVRALPGGDGGEVVVGTGPFRVASREDGRTVLEKNPRYWRGEAARLDAIEFRRMANASAVAEGLRSNELDIGRALLAEDLEQLLRDPRRRAGFVEVAQKNICLVLFNASSPVVSNPALRRALSGVLRTRDLVWSALGRFAQPATGLIPPGMLGHDPGRKRQPLTREQARALVELSGVEAPVSLRLALSPGMRDRFAPLTLAVLDAWAELGVTTTVVTPDLESYLASWRDNDGVDVLIGWWNADYDDPDNFTNTLFRSETGLFHRYFSCPETDLLGEEARGEGRAAVRETLYRKYENVLLEAGVVVPLCHEIDYRFASPRVRGLRLTNSSPYVNYSEIGKADADSPPRAPARTGGGVITVPSGAELFETLDPATIATAGHAEVLTNVFETLTRVVEGARVVPWLASDARSEEGGRLLRFRLRENLRFHDGRRLTARDVRYTFERLLQNRRSKGCGLLSPIRGAAALIDGNATDLEGFRIVSSSEFTIELDRPVSFFPVLLTDPCTAIVPEGSDELNPGWREGVVGTGPYRVAKFEPRRHIELERNPDYWREGLPKNDGLVFEMGVDFRAILNEFRAGRFSLAHDLLPADVESLRHDSGFASTYRETPSLSTTYIAFNARSGPLTDPELRRRLARSFDVSGVVRRAMGRYTAPALGLIPPGLLGYEPTRRTGPLPPLGLAAPDEVELRVAASPAFVGRLSQLTEEIRNGFADAGARLKIVTTTPEMRAGVWPDGEVDVIFSSWGSDYPDADSFAHGLLHSTEGILGSLCGTEEIDNLIRAGRLETDPAARHAIYRQIEQIVARDALVLPLFHPQKYRFARPEVEGLRVTSLSYPVVAYEELRVRR